MAAYVRPGLREALSGDLRNPRKSVQELESQQEPWALSESNSRRPSYSLQPSPTSSVLQGTLLGHPSRATVRKQERLRYKEPSFLFSCVSEFRAGEWHQVGSPLLGPSSSCRYAQNCPICRGQHCMGSMSLGIPPPSSPSGADSGS